MHTTGPAATTIPIQSRSPLCSKASRGQYAHVVCVPVECTDVVTLTVLFSMTMTDEYAENPEALMFEGVGPFTFNGLFKFQVESSIAVMRMLIPVFIGIVIIVASATYGHMKKTKAKAKRAEEIARSRMKDAAHISVETMSATFDI